MNVIMEGLTQQREGTVPQKGQMFMGRVLSITDGIVDIKTAGGSIIKAYAENGVELPSNANVNFEVVDSSKDKLVIRPLLGGLGGAAGERDMLIGMLSGFGIDPTPENISFLKDGGFMLGKNVEKLMALLSQEGKQGEVNVIKDIFVKPGELLNYLKDFEGGDKFLKMVETLISSIGRDDANSKSYGSISANILKGLSIQINNDLPLFLIPVPMYFEDQPLHGEIWIEKDGTVEKEGKSIIYIHLLTDTQSFGRIEADIRSDGYDMGLDIYCRKDVLPLFEKYTGDLKKNIRELGLNVMDINLSELKKNRNFLDFAYKYVKPFTPVDIRV